MCYCSTEYVCVYVYGRALNNKWASIEMCIKTTQNEEDFQIANTRFHAHITERARVREKPSINLLNGQKTAFENTHTAFE